MSSKPAQSKELSKPQILIDSAVETIKADGLKVFLQESLRYVRLYGSPVRIGNYWLKRASNHDVQIVNIQGSLMELNLKDRGINADLFINRIREPQATRYVQQIMKPDWTVIEIGANIGYYAMMEARLVKRVYAIEPGPSNYQQLISNIRLNKYTNIIPYQLAIGDHNGEVGFEIAKACNWSRIAMSNETANVNVRMQTLDSFIKEQKIGRVDYLRMDVEGYEYAIVEGARKTIERDKPDMFVEVHRDRLADYGHSQLDFMEMMAGYGYWIRKSYISAMEGPKGKVKDLLGNAETRARITTRGIASHYFFTREKGD
jgi:FkbM family methyltransferase